MARRHSEYKIVAPCCSQCRTGSILKFLRQSQVAKDALGSKKSGKLQQCVSSLPHSFHIYWHRSVLHTSREHNVNRREVITCYAISSPSQMVNLIQSFAN